MDLPRSTAVVLALLPLLGCSRPIAQPPVHEVAVPDPVLNAAIRTQLQIAERPLTTADLTRIAALDLRESKVESLEGLQHCAGLAQLDLAYTKVTDLTPLANLPALETLGLQLSGWETEPVPRDLRLMELLPKLRRLDISGNRHLQGLTAGADPGSDVRYLPAGTPIEIFPGLPALEDLTARYGAWDGRHPAGWLTSFAPLAKISTLRHIDLTDQWGIKDLDQVSRLPHLERLILDWCGIRHLTNIGPSATLQELSLAHAPLSELNGIERFPALRVFHAPAARGLSLTTSLSWPPQMEELDLSASGTVNLETVADCASLQVLNVAWTTVEEWRRLSDLPVLRRLTISGDQLAEVAMVSGLERLEALTVENGGPQPAEHLKLIDDLQRRGVRVTVP